MIGSIDLRRARTLRTRNPDPLEQYRALEYPRESESWLRGCAEVDGGRPRRTVPTPDLPEGRSFRAVVGRWIRSRSTSR